MTLLRPSPLGDLHLHFLAVGIKEDELVLIDRDFHGIANNQSLAGITCAAPHTLPARGVDDALHLDSEDRPSEARAIMEPLVIGDIDELTRLEFMIRGAERSRKRQSNRDDQQHFSQAMPSRLNAFHNTPLILC